MAHPLQKSSQLANHRHVCAHLRSAYISCDQQWGIWSRCGPAFPSMGAPRACYGWLHRLLRKFLPILPQNTPHTLKVVVASRKAEHYIRKHCGQAVEVALGQEFGGQAFSFNDKGFTAVAQQRPALIRQEFVTFDRNGGSFISWPCRATSVSMALLLTM